MSHAPGADVWNAGALAGTLFMWTAMMAVMMLPATLPIIRLVARSPAQTDTWSPATLFTAGYLLVWLAFSAVATLLQATLLSLSLLAPELSLARSGMAAGVFFLAGAYQWTRWKTTCLTHCQTPLDFVLRHWREGPRGAVTMGVRYGTYCLGCCWALMLVLFAVGVMNIAWVAALALVVLAEKTLVRGPWLSRLAGAVLITTGALTLSGLR